MLLQILSDIRQKVIKQLREANGQLLILMERLLFKEMEKGLYFAIK
jgi:hypothetical protein